MTEGSGRIRINKQSCPPEHPFILIVKLFYHSSDFITLIISILQRFYSVANKTYDNPPAIHPVAVALHSRQFYHR